MRTLCEAVHNHTRCSGWLYFCMDCRNFGCGNSHCPNQAFKDGHCNKCGSRSKETVSEHERRIRNEKDDERKRAENEKRNNRSRNESLTFGAGVATGSFISKRNQKKINKEIERIQRVSDSLTPNRDFEKDEKEEYEAPIVYKTKKVTPEEIIAQQVTEKNRQKRDRIEREERDRESRRIEAENKRQEQEHFDMWKGLASVQYDFEGMKQTREWEKKVKVKFKELIDKGYKLKDFLKEFKGVNVEGWILREYKIREFYYDICPNWLIKIVNFFDQ